MTKEQREAIKSLNEFVNTKYGAFTAKEGQTVLSMLKEQQEENKKKDKIINEQLKENVKLQAELNTENNRCMILANNDKFKEQIIGLMVEWISERCFYKDDYSNSCEIIQDSCSKEDDCKDCIKQYFANKVNSKIQ